VAGVTVQQPVWVSRLERGEGHGQWDVYGDRGRLAGRFSHVVIAHNGKCADKLVSSAGAPRVHQLLRTKFCPKATTQQVGWCSQMLQCCWLHVLPAALLCLGQCSARWPVQPRQEAKGYSMHGTETHGAEGLSKGVRRGMPTHMH
jgi:hypothetical protein